MESTSEESDLEEHKESEKEPENEQLLACMVCGGIHSQKPTFTSIYMNSNNDPSIKGLNQNICPKQNSLLCKYCNKPGHTKLECPLIYCKYCRNLLSHHTGLCQNHREIRKERYRKHIENMSDREFMKFVSRHTLYTNKEFFDIQVDFDKWLIKNREIILTSEQYDFLHTQINMIRQLKNIMVTETEISKDIVEMGIKFCKKNTKVLSEIFYIQIPQQQIGVFIKILDNIRGYVRKQYVLEKMESILCIPRSSIIQGRLYNMKFDEKLHNAVILNPTPVDIDMYMNSKKSTDNSNKKSNKNLNKNEIEEWIRFCRTSEYVLENKEFGKKLNGKWKTHKEFYSLAKKKYLSGIDHHKYCVDDSPITIAWFKSNNIFDIKECWCTQGTFAINPNSCTYPLGFCFNPSKKIKERYLKIYYKLYKKKHWKSIFDDFDDWERQNL